MYIPWGGTRTLPCSFLIVPLSFLHSLLSLSGKYLNLSFGKHEGLGGWNLIPANKKQGTQKGLCTLESPTRSCSTTGLDSSTSPVKHYHFLHEEVPGNSCSRCFLFSLNVFKNWGILVCGKVQKSQVWGLWMFTYVCTHITAPRSRYKHCLYSGRLLSPFLLVTPKSNCCRKGKTMLPLPF